MKDFFTLQEIAEFMGYKSTSTLRQLIKEDKIKATRIGKKTWVVYADDMPAVRAVLDERANWKRGAIRGKPRKVTP